MAEQLIHARGAAERFALLTRERQNLVDCMVCETFVRAARPNCCMLRSSLSHNVLYDLLPKGVSPLGKSIVPCGSVWHALQ